jgi:hypothetical protein
MSRDPLPDLYGPPDLRGELSGVHDENGREMTFAELHELCKREIRLFDAIGPKTRMTVQRGNDPHYTPIEPFAGLTRKRRRG